MEWNNRNGPISQNVRAQGQASETQWLEDTPVSFEQQDRSNNGDDGEGSNKRRRTALACNTCRSRKTRCDGHRPQCSGCQESRLECLYTPPATTVNALATKEYLASLESRLKYLEGRVDVIEGEPTDRPPINIGERATRGGSLSKEYNDANTSESHDSTDGMGSVMFGREQDCGFFGPSSNIALAACISRAIPQESHLGHIWPIPDQNADPTMNVAQARYPQRGLHRSIDDKAFNLYELPAQERVRELISHYFSEPGLLFPFIHESTFVATYEAMMRSGPQETSQTWLGLLNAVLALSTSTIVKPGFDAEERVKESDVYYRRASGLCQKRIMYGTCSLEVVHYLLTIGQYLQGSQKSNQTWTIHGMAVKAALQLGLHSRQASNRFSPLEAEIRKRTWFVCILIDRTLSMTFGRPASIPQDYIKVDLPGDFPASEHEITLSPKGEGHTKNISVPFFTKTITLYHIMWEVIHSCYADNFGGEDSVAVFDNASRLFKLEHQLSEWKRSLPARLSLLTFQQIADKGEDTDISTKFKTILSLRYLNLRILLHRTVLVKFLSVLDWRSTRSEKEELDILKQLGSSSMQICEQSSQEIINIIGHVTATSGPQRNLLGAWWFTLYYVFNAALVLFGIILIYRHPSWSDTQSETMDLVASFNTAIEALGNLDPGNKLVTACRQHLQQLSHVLNSPRQPQLVDRYALLESDILDFGDNIAMNATFNYMNNDPSPLGMDLGEFLMQGAAMGLYTNSNNIDPIVGSDGTEIE